MPALSVMSPEEQRLHGHSKNKERFVKATRFIRELTIGRAYTLHDELDACKTQEERDTVLRDWAEESGRDTGALRDDLIWTGALKEDDLRGAFIAERIEDFEWQKRIGVSHLRRIGKVFNVVTGEIPTSQERAALVVATFHANWTVKELEAELIRRNLRKPPKKRLKPPTPVPPVKLPTTAAGLLELILVAVKTNDAPLTITRGGKAKIAPALRKLADLIEQKHPGAEFRIGEAKTDGQVQ